MNPTKPKNKENFDKPMMIHRLQTNKSTGKVNLIIEPSGESVWENYLSRLKGTYFRNGKTRTKKQQRKRRIKRINMKQRMYNLLFK